MATVTVQLKDVAKKAKDAAYKAELAASRAVSVENQFLQAHKEMLKVVIDLQATSARATEQLASYQTTLMEILFTLRTLANERKAS